MATRIRSRVANDKELESELIRVSIENPGKFVTAYVFDGGIVSFYLYKSLGSIKVSDIAAHKMLLFSDGKTLAYADGNPCAPTPKWLTKKALHDSRNHATSSNAS